MAVGETTPALLDETMSANLTRRVAAFGDREALVESASGRRWTWAEFDRDVEQLARGFMGAGIEAGDRVGIWAPNCAEWTLVQFATARIGAILVNVNPSYRTHEFSYAVNQSGMKLLVAATSFKASDYRAMVEETAADNPTLQRVVYLDDEDSWNSLVAAGQGVAAEGLAVREAGLKPDDPINIQYTSGTPGFPKGATLSHRNILNNGYMVGEVCRYTEHDRVAIPVPFYHCFGMVMGNLACSSHGSTMVIPAPGFDPALTLQAVSEERCTSLYGVPTMFIAEWALPDLADYDLFSVRTGIMAGSPCPAEMMKKLIDADGWMHTGDLAVMDEDGCVRITGRIKDMVIRGGENIYPREIEEFLCTHPDIEDVQVIGVPDAKYGEELCAWVRMRTGCVSLDAEAIREFSTGKLAHYKIPRYVMVVDEFPMTVTGKIRKVEMRAVAARELGLE